MMESKYIIADDIKSVEVTPRTTYCLEEITTVVTEHEYVGESIFGIKKYRKKETDALRYNISALRPDGSTDILLYKITLENLNKFRNGVDILNYDLKYDGEEIFTYPHVRIIMDNGTWENRIFRDDDTMDAFIKKLVNASKNNFVII